MQQVRGGFVVDEDEEIESRSRRRSEKKRSRPREEEHLDEEDLELIGEHVPGLNRGSAAEVCKFNGIGLDLVSPSQISTKTVYLLTS